MASQPPSIDHLTKKIRLINELEAEVPIRTQGIEAKRISATPDGMDPHHASGQTIRYQDVYFFTVFEYLKDPQRNIYADLFVAGERRPFRVQARGIAYQEFLGQPNPNAQVNFYSFVLNLLEKTDSICLDSQTINYLKTRQPHSYQTIHDVEAHTRKIWHRIITKLKFACPSCSEIYWVDRSAIPDEDPRLRCKKCQSVFPISVSAPEAEGAEPLEDTAPPPGGQPARESSSGSEFETMVLGPQDRAVFQAAARQAAPPEEAEPLDASPFGPPPSQTSAPKAPAPSTYDETMVSSAPSAHPSGYEQTEEGSSDFSSYLSGVSADSGEAVPAGPRTHPPPAGQPPEAQQPASPARGPAPEAPVPPQPPSAPQEESPPAPFAGAQRAAAQSPPSMPATTTPAPPQGPPSPAPAPSSEEDTDISFLFSSSDDEAKAQSPAPSAGKAEEEEEEEEEKEKAYAGAIEDERIEDDLAEKKPKAARRSLRKREVREGFSRWNRLTIFSGVVILLSFFLLPWISLEGNRSMKAFELVQGGGLGANELATTGEEEQAVIRLSDQSLLLLIGLVGAVVILFAFLSAVGLVGSTISGFIGAICTLAVFLYGFWLWFDAANLLDIIHVTGFGVYLTFFALFVAILGNLIRSGWIPSERLE